jgi:hypothetical protein
LADFDPEGREQNLAGNGCGKVAIFMRISAGLNFSNQLAWNFSGPYTMS